jgi:hypothetical protein
LPERNVNDGVLMAMRRLLYLLIRRAHNGAQGFGAACADRRWYIA